MSVGESRVDTGRIEFVCDTYFRVMLIVPSDSFTAS